MQLGGGVTQAVSATGTQIHTKTLASVVTTLIISNEVIDDIMKIVKSLEESGLLTKDVKSLKRRISWYVTTDIRCRFIEKYVSR